MNLSLAEIRPGIVLEVNKQDGVIKATCLGLFSEADPPENLPPIHPFPLAGANSYSAPKPMDEVWVMFFKDNPLELFYFRKDIFPETLQELLKKDYLDCEVLATRDKGYGMVQLYFIDGDGWVIRNIDTIIQLKDDGSILLKTPWGGRAIDINFDNISLGSEGKSKHTAAFGDKTVESLEILNNMLVAVSEAAKKIPYTVSIATAIDTFQQSFEDSLEEIESDNVTLD